MQEVIASFFVIVVVRGQIAARGQVFIMCNQYLQHLHVYPKTLDFHQYHIFQIMILYPYHHLTHAPFNKYL